MAQVSHSLQVNFLITWVEAVDSVRAAKHILEQENTLIYFLDFQRMIFIHTIHQQTNGNQVLPFRPQAGNIASPLNFQDMVTLDWEWMAMFLLIIPIYGNTITLQTHGHSRQIFQDHCDEVMQASVLITKGM